MKHISKAGHRLVTNAFSFLRYHDRPSEAKKALDGFIEATRKVPDSFKQVNCSVRT